MNDYLSKPIEIEKLQDSIKQAVERMP